MELAEQPVLTLFATFLQVQTRGGREPKDVMITALTDLAEEVADLRQKFQVCKKNWKALWDDNDMVSSPGLELECDAWHLAYCFTAAVHKYSEECALGRSRVG